MVNLLSLLAARALPQSLERRATTTFISSFTNAFTTHFPNEPSDAIRTVTAVENVVSVTRTLNGITYKTVTSHTESFNAPIETDASLTTIFTPSPFCLQSTQHRLTIRMAFQTSRLIFNFLELIELNASQLDTIPFHTTLLEYVQMGTALIAQATQLQPQLVAK